MRVSAIQMDMKFADPAYNFKHAEELIREAAASKPDVIVLPETWNTGFFPKENLKELSDKDGAAVKDMCSALARELNVNIVAGSVSNVKNDKVYNTAYVFDRQGACIAEYDKTHLFTPMGEHDYYEAGTHVTTFELDGKKCGIMTGYFSPTEAAAVATAYALIVGLFIYHELDLKSIWEAFVNASKSTGQILIIVALASLFSWVITVAQVPQTVSAFLQANIHSKVAMLLLINVILLIAGTFIDTTSAIVIFAPLFIPICNALNIDLVHFGMIMAVNLTIGMCTPPLGVCLFVSSSIAKISLKDQMRDLLPMLAVLIGVLLLVTYIPGLTLWLPSLFK